MSAASDVWGFVLPNGQTAAQALMNTQTMVRELWRLQGLDENFPLIVAAASRLTGDIEQTVSEAAGVVTVSRVEPVLPEPGPSDLALDGQPLELDGVALELT